MTHDLTRAKETLNAPEGLAVFMRIENLETELRLAIAEIERRDAASAEHKALIERADIYKEMWLNDCKVEIPAGLFFELRNALAAKPAVPEGWQKVIEEVVSNIGEQCSAVNEQEICTNICHELDKLCRLLPAAPKPENE